MLKDCDDGIFLLQGNKSCNIYFIQRKVGVIIDTGHPNQAVSNLTALKDFGIKSNDVHYIINTHSHPDHVGGNVEFLKYFKEAKIINSTKTKFYQERKKQYALYQDIEDTFEDYPISFTVNDADVLDLSDANIRFVETPGHTADSISLELDNKFLFSGDTLYQKIIPQVDYYQDLTVSLSELKKSYDKLQASSCKKIFPGHGTPFEKTDKIFNMLNRKLSKFMDNPLLLLINTICPLLELFFKKNPGKTMEEIIPIFEEYLQRPVCAKLWPTFENIDFYESIEKALFLMKTMNMITIDENGGFFLNGELNSHL